MNIFQYIKDKIRFILLWVICFVLIFAMLLLSKIATVFLIAVSAFYVIFGIVSLMTDFSKKSRFYRELLTKVNTIEKPYDIVREVEAPDFFEGEALLNTLEFCLNAQQIDKSIVRNEYVFLREHISNILKKYSQELMTKKISTVTKNLECSVHTDGILFDLIIEQIFSFVLENSESEKPYVKVYAVQNERGVLLYAETNSLINAEAEQPQITVCRKICKALEAGFNITENQNTVLEIDFVRMSRTEK